MSQSIRRSNVNNLFQQIAPRHPAPEAITRAGVKDLSNFPLLFRSKPVIASEESGEIGKERSERGLTVRRERGDRDFHKQRLVGTAYFAKHFNAA